MPSGSLPTYAYRPPIRPTVPARIRTCSSRRSRLWAGGTYFRARDPGLKGNNITIEVVEDGADAYCIVTNWNLKYEENVIGPVKTQILDLKTDYGSLWKIDQLDTSAPRTQYYSISLRIAFCIQHGLPYTLPTPTQIPGFTVGKLFSDPGKLSVQTAKTTVNFTPLQTISITQRHRIYQLSLITKDVSEAPVGGGPSIPEYQTGWDIDALRAQINVSDPWIEMMPRSGPTSAGPGLPPMPNLDPPDIQDPGIDDLFLMPFSRTNLGGGDGLPDNPNLERTGQSRSLVHVNYGEQHNGKLAEHNTVYEWVGDNSIAGLWKGY